jgi:pheromone shutdown protein TraB
MSGLLGLPTKELKQAAEHADRTLTEVDLVARDARATLAEARRLLENLRVLTEVLRAAVTGTRPEG